MIKKLMVDDWHTLFEFATGELLHMLAYPFDTQHLNICCVYQKTNLVTTLRELGVASSTESILIAIDLNNKTLLDKLLCNVDYTKPIKRSLSNKDMLSHLLQRIDLLGYRIDDPVIILRKVINNKDRRSFVVITKWLKERIDIDILLSSIIEKIIHIGWFDDIKNCKLEYQCLKRIIKYESIAMKVLEKYTPHEKKELIELCCIYNSIIVLSKLLDSGTVDYAINMSVTHNSHACFKIITSKYQVAYLPVECTNHHLAMIDEIFLSDCKKYMSARRRMAL